ncbi:hypothetical protein [Streptomyces sp.]|uniref:hypothetical protein n=1 Tax=Streptomyces sp. TaxID=1931 RepID=UPI002D76CABE|nr:hypothetical protein [Streptomyces sp.]HET6355440.1 hypothetical protein [Streptomyces sp.]
MDTQISALDVPQVGFEVEIDVLLVAMPGGTGEGLLSLDPPPEVVAAELVRKDIRAAAGGIVELLGLRLGVVLRGEPAAAYPLPLAPRAGLQLEVEVPPPVGLLLQLRATTEVFGLG